MKLSHQTIELNPVHPFVIARGGASDHRVVKVTLRDSDGVVGWGEASPNRFYGETPETAIAALERLKPIVEASDPFRLEALEADMNAALKNNGSVKSAISAIVPHASPHVFHVQPR
jgi:L-alanine-DL-glutamate epimerase-like enolase superfamily enzyme